MVEQVRQPDEHDLVYVGTGGFPEYVSFQGQATTNQIAEWRMPEHRYVLQKISGAWEVYDLETLKPYYSLGTDHTIGIPKFTHEDFDAALMWALMNL